MNASTPNTPRSPAPPSTLPTSIPSQQLLQGAREIVILHAGQPYRLRVTAQGKLILTK